MGGFVRLILPVLLIVVFQQHVVYGHSGNNDGGTVDEPSSVTDLRAKGLIDVKIYCLVILLVTTFAGGVSPYFFRWNESFLLLGTQFAGGVFLGTSMMHFLADANSTVQDLTTKAYPFVYMLACVGYLLTMLGDILVHFVANRSRKNATKVDTTGSVAEEKGREERNIDMNLHEGFVKANTLGDTILLIFALCFHSVFEGIAIGVADTKANAWKNLWTISLHKIFAAIAMGIALLRMLPKRPLLTTAAYALAFAVSSPVGVGIGIAIDATTQGRVADWTFVVSMGLATGVFVYVAITHLIAKGFVPQHQSYLDTPFFKFLAVAAGVGVIAVVMIWD